jgi:hypothetical protein
LLCLFVCFVILIFVFVFGLNTRSSFEVHFSFIIFKDEIFDLSTIMYSRVQQLIKMNSRRVQQMSQDMLLLQHICSPCFIFVRIVRDIVLIVCFTFMFVLLCLF